MAGKKIGKGNFRPGTKLSLNPLPPTLRGKKRYILFELKCGKKLDEHSVSRALWNELLGLFGELGTAERKPWLVLWAAPKSSGILRCSHRSVDDCIAAISFMREVEGSAVLPKTLLVSGSISKLKVTQK